MLDVRTHTDGGQTAGSVAERIVTWIAGARETLDLALYDVRLPGAVGDGVADAIRDAAARGVRVRIAMVTPGAEAGGCPASGCIARHGQPNAEHRNVLREVARRSRAGAT
jgi:phosphatidylserine/phosphatidylglycerophosphate/cardiolipin synthase-like enzyme